MVVLLFVDFVAYVLAISFWFLNFFFYLTATYVLRPVKNNIFFLILSVVLATGSPFRRVAEWIKCNKNEALAETLQRQRPNEDIFWQHIEVL